MSSQAQHLDELVGLRLLDGELAPDEAQRWRGHARGCEACAELLAALAKALLPSGPDDGTGPRMRAGDRIGRHVLIELLGRGGMGEVWSADDEVLGRRVAVKLLHAHIAFDARDLLLREGRALARLSDPHIVAVLGVVRDPRADALVMELVEGTTLARWELAPERRTAEIVAAYRDAALGLAAAHRAGVVHRDFKPANVIVGADGRARVLDFGLASVSAALVPTADGGDRHASMAGGTPSYAAPEVLAGARADARSDQFSLCIALADALGIASTWSTTTTRPQRLAPARPVSRRLRRAIVRGCALDPAERHPDMDRVVALLGRTRPAPAIAAVVAVALAGVVAAAPAIVPQPRPCAADLRAIDAVWNEDSRAEIADAFDQLDDARHAPILAARIDDELTRFAQRWRDDIRASCGETTLAGAQLRCLELQVEDLAAVVDRARHAERGQLWRVLHGLTLLPSPDACRTPPASPDDASYAARLHRTLVEIRDESGVDDAAEQLARARAVVAQVEALAHAALTAEARHVLGQLLAKAGRFDEAYDALVAAELASVAAGDRWRTRAVILDRIDLALIMARFDDAERAIAGARVLVGDDDDAELHARLTLLEAELAGGRGDVVAFQRALALAVTEAPAGGAVQRNALRIQARAAIDRGDFPGAIAATDAELAASELWYGVGHPDGALTWSLRCGALLGQHQPRDAIAACEHAVALGRSSLPDAGVAVLEGNLAVALADLGERERARVLLLDVVPRMAATFGDQHPEHARVLQSLAVQELAVGRHADALVHADAAIAIADALGDAWLAYYATTVRARALVGLERRDEAIAAWRTAIALRRRDLAAADADAEGADDLGFAHLGLARVLVDHGLPEAARAALHEARAYQSLVPTTPLAERVAVDLLLARAASDPRAVRAALERASVAIDPDATDPATSAVRLELALWRARLQG